jgi:hypothetical protein
MFVFNDHTPGLTDLTFLNDPSGTDVLGGSTCTT